MVATPFPDRKAHRDLAWEGARWMDPTVGRWLSEDPSGLIVDADPYRYVGNSPTNATDPSGLAECSIVRSVILRKDGSSEGVLSFQAEPESGDVRLELNGQVIGGPVAATSRQLTFDQNKLILGTSGTSLRAKTLQLVTNSGTVNIDVAESINSKRFSGQFLGSATVGAPAVGTNSQAITAAVDGAIRWRTLVYSSNGARIGHTRYFESGLDQLGDVTVTALGADIDSAGFDFTLTGIPPAVSISKPPGPTVHRPLEQPLDMSIDSRYWFFESTLTFNVTGGALKIRQQETFWDPPNLAIKALRGLLQWNDVKIGGLGSSD